jgi:hypothetical protein
LIDRESQRVADLHVWSRQVAHESKSEVGVVGFDGVVHRGEEVVGLGAETLAHLDLLRPPDLLRDPSCELAVELVVAGPSSVGLAVIGGRSSPYSRIVSNSR